MIIFNPSTVLLLLFNYIIFCTLSSSTEYASERYSHPLCSANFTEDPVLPVAKSVTDITHLFDGIGLPDGACVFNPAVVHVAGRIYCLFARVYQATDSFRRCRPGHLDRSPFLDGWRGRSTNVLAVLRLRKRLDSRQLHAKLLGYSYLGQSNHEDGRLFKDKHGRVFVYMALPLGTPPKRAVVNTVSRVLIRCVRASDNCSVSLGYPRLLSYFGGESVMDKNWVPWNGTAFMSYSRYGTFGPHSVFNWGSYDEPTFHTGFDAVAEDSVFPRFAAFYGNLMHLSGGSPAILEEGGRSFLAIGHLKAHPGCFHPEVTPAWANMSFPKLLPGVQDRCAHLAQSSNAEQKTEELRKAFSFGNAASIGVHYPLEYAFFFYRRVYCMCATVPWSGRLHAMTWMGVAVSVPSSTCNIYAGSLLQLQEHAGLGTRGRGRTMLLCPVWLTYANRKMEGSAALQSIGSPFYYTRVQKDDLRGAYMEML
ncbi:hypothetical protein VaNZ11_009207 [Volvox africanus]|uniref:Uncharacterized protein n=1 Tax=Volvox africanus TaxID=51714 RepID=A0ABQ5S729_9CHLO|nr:hypothetical protein VaNZ11_009207 [Volvox africanus]